MQQQPKHLVVHTSQKTEHLLTFLLANVREPISAFGKHTILVANSGMQRYLELHIAKALGICSHVNLTYVGSFLWQCQQTVLANKERKTIGARSLSYLIYHYLNDYLATDNSEPRLNQALSGLANAAQRFNFAGQIAELFIRYSEHRPQILKRWQANQPYSEHPHEAWQRLIYQSLQLDSQLHSDNQDFLKIAQQQAVTDSEKIHVFGFHHLSPTHLAELLAIAEHTPVYFYALNPSEAYWFDILDDKQKAKLAEPAQLNLFDDNNAGLFSNGNADDNPLLASWGKAGKYLLGELANYEPILYEELYKQNQPPKHLLAAIQSAIFKLEFTPEIDFIDLEKDSSFVINSTASPRREVEVLHDHLLDLLNNSDVRAADIIVMMPNLTDYSEHIHSVFGSASSDSDNYQHIPYSIANQSSAEENQDCKLLLHLLELIANDFTATEFFEFCHLPALRSRFAIDDAMLKTIRRWLSESNTSWGLSEDFRKHFALDESLTQQGHLQKLSDRLFYEYASGEIADSHLAQQFYGQKDSLDTLSNLIAQLKPFEQLKFQAKTLGEWKKTLRQLCATFLPQQNSLSEAEALVDDWFAEAVALADDEATIDFSVIQRDIKSLLTHHELRGPFLGGGVSFCVMQPMRAIPAKVICVLGMNENYPAYQPRLEFDLQTVKPQLSDKIASDECKYLFLESLLSAQQQFYVSYVGIDNQSAKDIAPSVMVQTLTNYLTQIDANFAERIQQRTQIHGFSAALFPDKTYSTLYQAPSKTPQIAESTESAQPAEAVAIAPPLFFATTNLASQLESPLDCYLQAHYQIRKPRIDEVLTSHDFIGLDDGMTNWQFKNALLQSSETPINHNPADLDELLLAKNMLAPPPLAQVTKIQAETEIADYLGVIQGNPIIRQESQGLISINETTIFHPTLYFSDSEDSTVQQLYFPHKCRTKSIFHAVLLHLIANHKLQADHPNGLISHCQFFDKAVVFSPVEDIAKYWQIIFAYLKHIYTTPSPFQLEWKLLKTKNEIICNTRFLEKNSFGLTQSQSDELYFKLAKRLLAEQTADIEPSEIPAVKALIEALPELVSLQL